MGSQSELTIASYDTGKSPTWCPGCGDFGIWISLKNALVKMGLGPDDVFLVYGIGCHGNMYSWMKTYACEGLHGRTLPVAQGIKLANHPLPVIIISGDGDGLGEGGNHFIHAAKRNPNVTVILHDNQLYSLTTGQASPTAKPGFKTKSTPEGVYDEPINPLTMSIAAGATYVARGFAGDAAYLTQLIVDAVNHKGFSLVDILQPCVTFDKIHTYAYYRQRVYRLDAEGYKPDNKATALAKAFEWGDRIPTGVFYQEEKPTSEDREAAIAELPLVAQPLEIPDIDSMLAEFI
ncbi:2-oxoacid ferredoxin oxidoreductase [Candidatus Gottesmanbacteria bacterium RBG_16_52_11]|uniref:2-oxoacid ferredoxin oxidoreductase n=1 Tax=Candidatus Gottesmanbacteria bacterium RBG_16_52_11 TaxID=1798374 RepID=A0A1F5YMG4_9BACT|nr:MAG: 2-oxoacid ferredoxin oxidoreductase [Candidatus Gottesmanbacteria bacterium RBG_16_52_11]